MDAVGHAVAGIEEREPESDETVREDHGPGPDRKYEQEINDRIGGEYGKGVQNAEHRS